MICKSCGATIEDEMMFCTECGARQQAWPEMKPHFCGKCGCKMLNAKDTVCADCRAKEQQEKEPTPKPESESEPTPQAVPEPKPEPETQLAAPAPQAELKPVQVPEVVSASKAVPVPVRQPAPKSEPEQDAKPQLAAQPKSEPVSELQPSFEPTAFAKEPGKKGKAARICIAVLVVIIICEALYYLFGMGGMKRIQSAMAKPQPTAGVEASEPQSGPTVSPALPPVSVPESTPELPPLPTVAEPAPTYEFVDWQKQIDDMRGANQAASAEFLPVPNAEELSEMVNGVARVKVGGKWGFLTNMEIGSIEYDQILPFSEGMAPVSKDGKWGYVDVDNNFLETAPCQWDTAGDFREGYAVVSLNGEYFLIDKQGNKVIESGYEKLRAYGSGLISALHNGKWGYINLEGRVVIPFEYSDAGAFASARAVVVKDNKTFFIDTLGNPVTREYPDAWGFNENHTAKVKTNNGYGLINTDGDFIIRPEWDNIWNLQEGVATVQKDGKYGYVSQSENTVVVQPIYSDVWSSTFGLIPIKAASGKWGYVDQVGNTAIEPQYDDAYIFGDGAARVSRDGKYGLIDITGKDICEFNYKQMGYIREGYCPAMNADGVWGFLKIGYR